MGIPVGVQTIAKIVQGGSGGPLADSIPVKEDLGGASIGYLKNDSIVKVPVSGYRKIWNGTTWVLFAHSPEYMGDNWIEETGHLFPVPVVEPEPPTPPAPPLEGLVTVEVVEETWKEGKHFMKIRNV